MKRRTLSFLTAVGLTVSLSAVAQPVDNQEPSTAAASKEVPSVLQDVKQEDVLPLNKQDLEKSVGRVATSRMAQIVANPPVKAKLPFNPK